MKGSPTFPLWSTLLLWFLGICSASQQGNFRQGKLDQGVPPPPAEMDPELEKGMKQFYSLQRVGLQKSGIAQPRSPLAEGHQICLTAGPKDSLQGHALLLVPCSDPDLTPDGMNPPNRSIQDLQAFHFLNNGQIRNKLTGLCIRRMLCGVTPVYDLGPCDEKRTSTTWVVSKAIAGQVSKMQYLGYPLIAVVKDMCNMCGPYQLLQKCKGVPMASNWGCGESSAPNPGWTKNPSAYLDPEIMPSEEHNDLLNDISSDMNDEDEVDGIGGAPSNSKQETCGTHLLDAPSVSSWFYFLKVGK